MLAMMSVLWSSCKFQVTMIQAQLQFLLEARWICSGKPPCWQLGAHEMVQAVRSSWQQKVQARLQTASSEDSEDLPLAAFAAKLQVSSHKAEPSRQVEAAVTQALAQVVNAAEPSVPQQSN